MAREKTPVTVPAKAPWYRSSAATFTAGVVGLAIIAGLVIAVVKMSSVWNTPQPQTFMPPGTYTPGAAYTAETTSTTSGGTSDTSFNTSVQLSTTDIGLPGETTTSGSTTSGSSASGSSTSPSTTTTTTPPTTTPLTTTPPTTTTTHTTRPGPRINVTRTLYPPP